MSQSSLHELGNIINGLATLSDAQLDEAVKAAKVVKAQALKDRIPQEQIDSMRTKYTRFCAGQSITVIIKPEIQATFKVQAEYEYGSVSDYSFELMNKDDKRVAAFFDIFINNVTVDDPHTLAEIEPRLNAMMEQETVAHRDWESDYYHLRDEFGVDPFEFLKDL